MRLSKYFLLFLPMFAACGNEQAAPVAYTFKGEVIVINNCNRSEEELPERVKVSYSLGEAGSGEQLIDLMKLDDQSRIGSFSLTITTAKEVRSYTSAATRPNGKSICLQLPCPSAAKCKEQGTKEPVALKEGITELTDTVKVICGCEM